MDNYEIGAHFGTTKKGGFFMVNLFFSSWENNQFRISIINKLEVNNYYLWRRNNLNSLAVCDCYNVLVSTVTKVESMLSY